MLCLCTRYMHNVLYIYECIPQKEAGIVAIYFSVSPVPLLLLLPAFPSDVEAGQDASVQPPMETQ